MQLNTPNIREVYETDDMIKVNNKIAQGWRVLAVAVDPYGKVHYSLGLPEKPSGVVGYIEVRG